MCTVHYSLKSQYYTQSTFTIFTLHYEEKNHIFYLAAVLLFETSSCTARHQSNPPSLLILPNAAETFLLGHVQFYSVNNPQNRENRQSLLAWCWLHLEHVKEQPMCALLERDISAEGVFFIFCCSEGIWRRKRTPVPKITENASEHRADCVQSVYNCVSCEPCPPSMLGSHAPFHTTLLYMRESKLILCIFYHFTCQCNCIQNV